MTTIKLTTPRVDGSSREESRMNPFAFRTGRMKRLPYLGWLLLCLIPLVAMDAAKEYGLAEPSLGVVLGVAALTLVISVAALGAMVQRNRDIGWTPLMLLLMWVPLVSFVYGVWLLFSPTDWYRDRQARKAAKAAAV